MVHMTKEMAAKQQQLFDEKLRLERELAELELALLELKTIADGTVYYPYNITWKRYHDMPLAGKRAFDFIDRKNQCKGGHWVLHSSEQYQQWYDTVGKHAEFLKHGQRGH